MFREWRTSSPKASSSTTSWDRARPEWTVRIWGAGFAPGQEVILLINDGPGTPSDITNYVTNTSADNTIVANDQGAWTTVWTLGRFTRQRSGIGPGDGDVERMRTLSVVDPGTLGAITTTPLAFCRLSDRVAIAADVAEMESSLALLQADREQGSGPEAGQRLRRGMGARHRLLPSLRSRT